MNDPIAVPETPDERWRVEAAAWLERHAKTVGSVQRSMLLRIAAMLRAAPAAAPCAECHCKQGHSLYCSRAPRVSYGTAATTRQETP